MLSNYFGSGYIIVIIHIVGMWMIFISFIEFKNTTQLLSIITIYIIIALAWIANSFYRTMAVAIDKLDEDGAKSYIKNTIHMNIVYF